MMAFALYAQHAMMLEPCPLCVLQRIAVIGVGLAFLAAALHNTSGRMRYLYSGVLGLFAAFGIGVAGRHVWLQSLPPGDAPACTGMNLETMFEYYPVFEVIGKVFQGSGECAEVDWQLLGLSMPAWVLIALIGLGGVGVWNTLRK